MKKLRICIIDIIHNSPSHSLYRQLMFPNYTSIMPQVIGVWCKQEGHAVNYGIFTGSQKIQDLLPDQTDLVFISSFTYTAQLAYAFSNYFRSRGIVTVLGGPHARSYPQDACLYFDFVLGLTDKALLKHLLSCAGMQNRPGRILSASSHPLAIPGVRERWEFIEKVHKQTILIKFVPMIGSLGCPYRCDFCIDSEIPYQALDMELIKEDLAYISAKMKRPVVGWYDPNFGIRFNSIMDAIESADPKGRIEHAAESSLSVLTEDNVKKLQRNGFKMIMPGIESWFQYGKKSGLGDCSGWQKVQEVAEQINMIQRYIPQVQTNFLYGLDTDQGPDPFTLTKRFIDMAPGAYPSFALLSVFGQCPESNEKYEMEDRIIPFPFHMLRSVHTLNIIPSHYSWEAFYQLFIDLLKYSFSKKAMYRRFKANHNPAPRWLTLLLSLTIGGWGKIRYLSDMLDLLRKEKDFQSFVKKDTASLPASLAAMVRKDLGYMWHWLPDKTLSYDPNVLTKGRLKVS